MDILFTVLFSLLAGAFGASIASFMGVVVERQKTGESINGRSHCACGRQLKASENVPVIGWLRTKGKAGCCGAQIPECYFWSEVGMFAAFAFCTLLCLYYFPGSVIALVGSAIFCVGFFFIMWMYVRFSTR